MKLRHSFIPLLAVCFSFTGRSSAATSQYWNFGGSGGDGNWGTTPGDKNWNLAAGAAVGNTFWPDTIDDVAVFQDTTGGTVTVFDAVQGTGIIQNGADYTVNAGTITLVRDSLTTPPFIDVQSGALTVDSTLAGSDGLRKTGPGSLILSGSNTYSGITAVTAGSLDLTGSLAGTTVDISTGATLIDANGGLAAAGVVTNAGILTVNAADTIGSLTNNAGTVNGNSTLTVTGPAIFNGGSLAAPLTINGTGGGIFTNATLSGTFNGTTSLDGGTVSGTVNGNTNSTGNVLVSGALAGGSLDVTGGVLTNTGTLTAATQLNITAGAILIANGVQAYPLLTTSGAGAGTWQGDLTNPTTLAPGGAGGIGTLDVTGDFSNTGTLKLDVGSAGHDLLKVKVKGTATFGGTLELDKLGGGGIAPLVPVNLISAGSYVGDFSILTENLDGAIWFNPGSGDITRVDPPSSSADGTLFGSTKNQSSSWISLYDDVIDPNKPNITTGPGGDLIITSGVANAGNPGMMWALAASTSAAGMNAALMNRLSPEVYAGLEDYAIQATRSHQRTALSAPVLGARPDPVSDGKAALPAAAARGQWEMIAAVDYFGVKTENSLNSADYDLSGMGILAGARIVPCDYFRFAAYLAYDDGSVDGSLIDADASGWSLGMIAEALVDRKTATRLTAGLSYGTYSFDGTRGSASATSAGWAAGRAGFSNVDSDSLELFFGMESTVYHNDKFRLIPSIGLRYGSGSMDSFSESTGAAAGSPLALDVSSDNYYSALAQFGVLAEADVTRELTLRGMVGLNAGLFGQSRGINARFANGSRAMRADADGLAEDALFIGLGADYRINDSLSVGLGYRTEFRSGADIQQGFNLTSTFRF